MKDLQSRLSFEFQLLYSMLDDYRAALLKEVGMSFTEASRLAGRCPLRVPDDLTEPPSTFAEVLGPAARTGPLSVSAPANLRGRRAQYFVLSLWPHLYWAVSDEPDQSIPFGACFLNQADELVSALDPAIVRPGVWTRPALERLADHVSIHDGWDERVTWRFHFGSTKYLGTFTFGLLDEWRRS